LNTVQRIVVIVGMIIFVLAMLTTPRYIISNGNRIKYQPKWDKSSIMPIIDLQTALIRGITIIVVTIALYFVSGYKSKNDKIILSKDNESEIWELGKKHETIESQYRLSKETMHLLTKKDQTKLKSLWKDHVEHTYGHALSNIKERNKKIYNYFQTITKDKPTIGKYGLSVSFYFEGGEWKIALGLNNLGKRRVIELIKNGELKEEILTLYKLAHLPFAEYLTMNLDEVGNYDIIDTVIIHLSEVFDPLKKINYSLLWDQNSYCGDVYRVEEYIKRIYGE